MNIYDRVEYIISLNELNKNSFSKALGFTNNVTIGRLINEKRKPSLDTLERIIKVFNINANWLVLGEGELHRNGKENRLYNIEKSLELLNKKIDKIQNIE